MVKVKPAKKPLKKPRLAEKLFLESSTWITSKQKILPLTVKTKPVMAYDVLSVIFFLIIWSALFYRAYKYNFKKIPMLIGFTFSVILLSAKIALQYFDYNIIVDRKSKQMYLSYTPSDWEIVFKNKAFNPRILRNNRGLLIPTSILNKLKAEHKIQSTPFTDLLKKDPHIAGHQEVSLFNVAVNKSMVRRSFYLIMTIFTISILTARTDKKLFETIYPLACFNNNIFTSSCYRLGMGN